MNHLRACWEVIFSTALAVSLVKGNNQGNVICPKRKSFQPHHLHWPHLWAKLHIGETQGVCTRASHMVVRMWLCWHVKPPQGIFKLEKYNEILHILLHRLMQWYILWNLCHFVLFLVRKSCWSCQIFLLSAQLILQFKPITIRNVVLTLPVNCVVFLNNQSYFPLVGDKILNQ